MIGGFKVPKQFIFVDALPKSALGKVLKSSLRLQIAARANAGAEPQTAA